MKSPINLYTCAVYLQVIHVAVLHHCFIVHELWLKLL